MRSLLSAVLALSLAGCLVDKLDTSSTSQSIVVDNRIAANRIAANRIAANRIAANRIAANRLTLTTNANDLINTDDGREVLTYIVSCAIPDGTTLVGTATDGTQYEFLGEIGLAPNWLEWPLDQTDEGWISACLFSRINAFDVAVPVSLRGPNAALATTPDELAGWTVQEGAFYGQYFLPQDEPIQWFACSGSMVAEAVLAQRVCASPDPAHPGLTLCDYQDPDTGEWTGVHYAGNCGDYATMAPPDPRACAEFSHNGYYLDCPDHTAFRPGHFFVPPYNGDHHIWDDHDQGHGWGGDYNHDHVGGYDPGLFDDHIYQQVITTFTQP